MRWFRDSESSASAYLPVMAKLKLKLPQWQITLIRGRAAARLGVVEASDADNAIKQAIREFQIDPQQQNRVAAYRIG